MTKSFELVIAIIILFSFLFIVVDSYKKPNNSLKISSEVQDLLKIKGNNNEFRSLVDNKDVISIYNTLYPYIDSNYSIIVCDYIDNNCIRKDEINTNNKNAVDYYFSDINKTLSLVFWVN